MQIDRARFLLLTSALTAFAGGCTINNVTTASDATTTDSGASSDTGSGGDSTLVDSTTADSGTSEVAETSGDTPGDTSAEASSEVSVDDADASDGAACTDDVPSPSDCATILTGTGCHDSVTPTAADTSCNDWVADLKPREAKEAQDCLTGLMTAAATDAGPTCVGVDWSGCAVTALEGSCDDSTAIDWCNNLITECAAAATDAGDAAGTPPTTLGDCQKLASGLTDVGRTDVHDCVITEGCGVSLRDCIGKL